MPDPAELLYLASLAEPPGHWGGTGALPLSPDPRDWRMRDDPAVAAMIPRAPPSASLIDYFTGQPYNQDNTGACVAASSCGACSLDTQHYQDAWHLFDWNALYREAGGTGQNGVDSRLVLTICKDKGTPLAAGGREFVIASYDFATQQDGPFQEEIKACIALGFPVVVAMLLPSDFGWQSGQPNAAVTQGYHQVCGIGYDPDYLVVLNSWGAGWPGQASPKPGVGSVRWSYLVANGNQQRYCYSYRTTAKNAQPTPPPKPLTVTGYSPNPVPATKAFLIQGTGFDAGTVGLQWQGYSLPAQNVTENQISSSAPAVTTAQTGPVTVTVAQKVVTGPALSVQPEKPDPEPPPATTAAVIGRADGAAVPTLKEGQPYSLAAPAGVTVTFTQIKTQVGPGPALAVSGYDPGQVKAGDPFVILGAGFAGGSVTARWGSMPLAVVGVNDTQLSTRAPAGAAGSNPVTVTVGNESATGPALPITADGGGGNGGDDNGQIKVMVTTKPSQYRNTVSVVVYTSDLQGGSLPASVNGTVTGPQGTVQLYGQTTHGTSSPAIWNVPRPAPWGTPCQVVVKAFTGGMTGTGTAVG